MEQQRKTQYPQKVTRSALIITFVNDRVSLDQGGFRTGKGCVDQDDDRENVGKNQADIHLLHSWRQRRQDTWDAMYCKFMEWVEGCWME